MSSKRGKDSITFTGISNINSFSVEDAAPDATINNGDVTSAEVRGNLKYSKVLVTVTNASNSSLSYSQNYNIATVILYMNSSLSKVYYSKDGGTNWITSADVSGAGIQSISTDEQGHWAAIGYNGTNVSRFTSSDGITFTNRGSFGSGYARVVNWISDMNAFVYGMTSGEFYISYDGGITYTVASTVYPSGDIGFGTAFSPIYKRLLVGSGTDTTVYLSDTYGSSWYNVPTGNPYVARHVAWANGYFIVGQGPAIGTPPQISYSQSGQAGTWSQYIFTGSAVPGVYEDITYITYNNRVGLYFITTTNGKLFYSTSIDSGWSVIDSYLFTPINGVVSLYPYNKVLVTYREGYIGTFTFPTTGIRKIKTGDSCQTAITVNGQSLDIQSTTVNIGTTSSSINLNVGNLAKVSQITGLDSIKTTNELKITAPKVSICPTAGNLLIGTYWFDTYNRRVLPSNQGPNTNFSPIPFSTSTVASSDPGSCFGSWVSSGGPSGQQILVTGYYYCSIIIATTATISTNYLFWVDERSPANAVIQSGIETDLISVTNSDRFSFSFIIKCQAGNYIMPNVVFGTSVTLDSAALVYSELFLMRLPIGIY